MKTLSIHLLVILTLAFCKIPTSTKERLHTDILTIAQKYSSLQKFSARLAWAPTACAPITSSIERPAMSRAKEKHGQKLHYLYVKYLADYNELHTPALLKGFEQKKGQVLVKESFEPVKVNNEGENSTNYLEKNGQWFKKGERLNLYIMLKREPAENNDNGWVYAVTSADGQKILESGKLTTCMNCHKNAANDRLFGQR